MPRNTKNIIFRSSYPDYFPKWFRYLEIDSNLKSYIRPNTPKSLYRDYRRYRIKTGFEVNGYHTIVKNEFYRVWRDPIIPAPTRLEVIAYKIGKLSFPLNILGIVFMWPIVIIEEKRLGMY